MIVYPAIDLKNGQCVRLYKGSFENVTVYPLDPLEVAMNYVAAGAEYLHLVDLGGAKNGHKENLNVVKEIVKKTSLKVQMGGGIRNIEYAKELLELGLSRIVIGSMAVNRKEEIKQWLKIFGVEKIVLALDVRFNKENLPMLTTNGWQIESSISLWDLMTDYEKVGVQHVLCTDVDCDGTLSGPNFSLYQDFITRYPAIMLQASGGVASLNDLVVLKEKGLSGVVIGKSLYEGNFDLQKAIEVGDVS